MSKKKDLLASKKEIMRMRKDAEKQERLIKASCSHQNHKGKLTVVPVGNRGDYVCEICGEEFNMNPISSQELHSAIQVVHNAIQQCRAFADEEEDAKLIKSLGETDYNNSYVLAALYKKTINHYAKGANKNKKKNKQRDEDFGSYSNGSFSTFGRR